MDVNYDPVGSGTGRENFLSEAYVFAGSDSALSDDEGEVKKAAERCGGTPAIEASSKRRYAAYGRASASKRRRACPFSCALR